MVEHTHKRKQAQNEKGKRSGIYNYQKDLLDSKDVIYCFSDEYDSGWFEIENDKLSIKVKGPSPDLEERFRNGTYKRPWKWRQ